ncbi:hypothetical protein EZS27_010105 [termite gut metagenome]|uniref:Uncharacterized protein n=1 Tax=termite gut metagenome TaxID=433724 RepID=A0A5J4S9R6_9ZZZZ
MKKILLILNFIFITLNSFGQNHFIFNNLEINGKVTNFIDKLTKNDRFKIIGKIDENCHQLYGNFIGKDKCRINVINTPKTKIVCYVEVFLSEDIVENNLDKELHKWIEIYKKKYEEPVVDSLNNKGYVVFSNDLYKGGIKIYISGDSILAEYVDIENAKLKFKEDEEIINEDI